MAAGGAHGWRGAVVVMGLMVIGAGVALADPEAEDVSGALDGKTFVGELGRRGALQGDAETFVFQQGTFHSTGGERYGFGDGPYLVHAGGAGHGL